MLVNKNIPGMQVPIPFRFLWLFSGVILFALANVNLSYLIAKNAAAPTLSPIARTSVPNPPVTEVKGGAADFCSLVDVVCDGESVTAVSTPSIASHPKLAENHFVDTNKMVTLKKVCAKYALGDRCAKDLYAMAWHESKLDTKAIGDQGRSRGAFQIQTKLHKIAVSQAEDFAWAADWSLSRMVDNGYKKGLRTYSVMRHNGFGPQAQRYARNVIAYANNLE